jgi:hypothetical protein
MVRAQLVEDITPGARGLIRTFSGYGYEFGQSVADLIDNSIDAGATRVDIEMEFDGPNSWMMIADNGVGVSRSALREALRPGTERNYEKDDKGKFGLGLKTASLTHCTKLTIVSRTDPGRRRLDARTLDVHHIRETNKWEVLVVSPPDRAASKLASHTGTVVLWERLESLLQYQIPWGKRAENRFFELVDQLERHLSMVFHRFLSGEARRKKPLEIWINSRKIDPWDPFARSEKHTQDLGIQEIEIHTAHGKGIVAFHPYILPNQKQFSTPAEFKRLGRDRWNDLQGFYVYRCDRLIQAGGWSRMRAKDEHTKYARASIEFQRDLDDAFNIGTSKTSVRLPEELRAQLEEPVNMLARAARTAYDAGAKSTGGDTNSRSAASSASKSASAGITGDGRRPKPSVGNNAPMSPPKIEPRVALERAAAAAGETSSLERIVDELRKQFPEVARAFGW